MYLLETSVLIKLGASIVFGMVIGLERELRKKPLGLKTSLVICVSSCLLTIVSIESAERYAEAAIRPMDPLRLAAQIVSGIGFLGAGVILRKQNDIIVGLTTAAMIWAACGLGIATGAGFYLEAFVGLCLIIISVELLPIIIKLVGPASLSDKEIKMDLTVSRADNRVVDILNEIKARDIKIKHVRITDIRTDSGKEGTHQVQLVIMVHEDRFTAEIYHEMKQIDFILSVQIENLSPSRR
ncbi:MgtC/SapB family protein [Ammoniphilus sp. CFH 90114]|uniref:MgtC/SapB family protein n=1 Tax=Ammoniphilus sp. CFH 90114 TaxID=2493665 RepID=UPI00100EAE60|nr:MgtC/SapB family protein [Ammoniphilus sp. CFH 90114]RXT05844.1 MgtC/SapB family protein [Ammoniphilus sp. CFH 90114]